MTVHTMVDIETMGTRPGAIILSVAFVRFSDEAHMMVNMSIEDQEMIGMEKDESTLAWWSKQDPIAWARATSNPQPLAIVLPYIATWLDWARAGDDFQLWCHGATFDAPLLAELYRRANIPCPWNFYQVRARTLYDLALINPKDYSVPPPHVALNDAIGQTRAANAALAILARAHQVAA